MDKASIPDGRTRIAFSTLGCKLNLYETDALATRFEQRGYDIVDFDGPADVYVINSCTVTNRADRKSRNLFYRAQRNQAGGPGSAAPGSAAKDASEPAPLVVLAGCFVDGHRAELESSGRTIVVPNDSKSRVFDIVEAAVNGELVVPDAGADHASVFDFPVPSRLFHTRTMIKVQDGCDNFCSFCIIPRVRGRAISRAPGEVVEAARAAIDGGARELVLTGVNMSRYQAGSSDGAAVGFAGLVESILLLDGDFRLRISSLEPDQLDDRFIGLFDHPKMCSHLHLCLQSGSERTLLAMRRQYTFSEFARTVGRLRTKDETFNVTTDIIVGFPGETDQDFEASLRAVEDLEFGHVHTFPYSERSGTRAAKMPGRIPERIRTERAAEVRRVAAAAKRRYRARLLGSVQNVLVEASDSEMASGFGQHYVPVKVPVPDADVAGADSSHNSLIVCRAVDLEDGNDPALIARQ